MYLQDTVGIHDNYYRYLLTSGLQNIVTLETFIKRGAWGLQDFFFVKITGKYRGYISLSKSQ